MDPATGADLDVLGTITKFLLIGMAGSFLSYLYFSITLMIIAQKSNTSASGLAWLPVINLWLMCWVGRRSGWWVLGMLVPGLNMLVFALIWASMAAVRGKPSWIGAMIVMPGLGLLVPLILAAGRRSPDGSAPTGPLACAGCGAPAEPGARFCGDCGKTIPVPEPTLRPIGAGHAFAVALLMVILSIGAYGGTGYYLLGRALDYSPPIARQEPTLPTAMAGTLTEFPIDTSTTKPVKPGSVVAMTAPPPSPTNPTPNQPGQPGDPPPKIEVPTQYLPPGIEPEGVEKEVTAITCIPYRAEPEDPPVNVSVCLWPGPEQAQRLAGNVAKATGGQQTGVRVQSPTGKTYTGSKISSPQNVVYVLGRPEANIVIIIYAPSPAVAPVAERLAQNVGNGRGILDDPGFQNSIGLLPAQPPADLALQQVMTTTPEELEQATNAAMQAPSGGAPSSGRPGGSPSGGSTTTGPAPTPPIGGSNAARNQAEMQRLQQQVKAFMPQRFTAARYRDASRRDWALIVCQFPTPRQALNTWWVIRLLAQGGGMTSTPVQGGTGLTAVVDKKERVLMFQKGPYLVFLVGPASGPASTLVQLANALQI